MGGVRPGSLAVFVPRGIGLARLIVFVAFFDLFLQYPVAAPFASTLGASPLFAGIIVAAYSVANLAGNVVAGTALDRFGRFVPLLVGAVAATIVVALYPLVVSPQQLLALRVLHGLAVAVLAPGAFALASDLATPERRSRVMGVNGAVIAVAAIIAPAVAGILQDRSGFTAVFWLDALLFALLAAALLIARPLVRPVDRLALEQEAPVPLGAILRRQIGPYLAIVVFTIPLGVLVTHLPERVQALGLPARLRGTAFSTYGLVAAVVMATPWVASLARRNWRWACTIGLTTVGLGLGLASGLPGSSLTMIERWTLAGMIVFGVGFGLLFPAVTTEVARRAEQRQRGRAFGVFYAIYSLGVVGGALVAGGISEFTGPSSGVPLLVGAIVALLGTVGVMWGRRVEIQ